MSQAVQPWPPATAVATATTAAAAAATAVNRLIRAQLALQMEATEPYTDDVTFAELRRFNLVGQRGPEPRQLLMTVANELAKNVQRGTSLSDQSIREISASYEL